MSAAADSVDDPAQRKQQEKRAIGVASGAGTSFEAALLLALVGFVGTVAYCKFLLRGDIIE